MSLIIKNVANHQKCRQPSKMSPTIENVANHQKSKMSPIIENMANHQCRRPSNIPPIIKNSADHQKCHFLKLWLHFEKKCYRYVTEMYIFLLLPYRDYRIAETLQKEIHFCSYPKVSAEIESFL